MGTFQSVPVSSGGRPARQANRGAPRQRPRDNAPANTGSEERLRWETQSSKRTHELDEELLQLGEILPGFPFRGIAVVEERVPRGARKARVRGGIPDVPVKTLRVRTAHYLPHEGSRHPVRCEFTFTVKDGENGVQYVRMMMAERKKRALEAEGLGAADDVVARKEVTEVLIPRMKELASNYLAASELSFSSYTSRSLRKVLERTQKLFGNELVKDYAEEEGNCDTIVFTASRLSRPRLFLFFLANGLHKGIESLWSLLLLTAIPLGYFFGWWFPEGWFLAIPFALVLILLLLAPLLHYMFSGGAELIVTKCEVLLQYGTVPSHRQRINLATIQDVTYRRSAIRGFSFIFPQRLRNTILRLFRLGEADVGVVFSSSLMLMRWSLAHRFGDVYNLIIFTYGSKPDCYLCQGYVTGLLRPDQIREQIMKQRKIYVEREFERREPTLPQLKLLLDDLYKVSEHSHSYTGAARWDKARGGNSDRTGMLLQDGPLLDDDVLASYGGIINRAAHILPWVWCLVPSTTGTLKLRSRILEASLNRRTLLLIPLTEIRDVKVENPRLRSEKIKVLTKGSCGVLGRTSFTLLCNNAVELKLKILQTRKKLRELDKNYRMRVESMYDELKAAIKQTCELLERDSAPNMLS